MSGKNNKSSKSFRITGSVDRPKLRKLNQDEFRMGTRYEEQRRIEDEEFNEEYDKCDRCAEYNVTDAGIYIKKNVFVCEFCLNDEDSQSNDLTHTEE